VYPGDPVQHVQGSKVDDEGEAPDERVPKKLDEGAVGPAREKVAEGQAHGTKIS
jgi:hypothetical protein